LAGASLVSLESADPRAKGSIIQRVRGFCQYGRIHYPSCAVTNGSLFSPINARLNNPLEARPRQIIMLPVVFCFATSLNPSTSPTSPVSAFAEFVQEGRIWLKGEKARKMRGRLRESSSNRSFLEMLSCAVLKRNKSLRHSAQRKGTPGQGVNEDYHYLLTE